MKQDAVGDVADVSWGGVLVGEELGGLEIGPVRDSTRDSLGGLYSREGIKRVFLFEAGDDALRDFRLRRRRWQWFEGG